MQQPGGVIIHAERAADLKRGDASFGLPDHLEGQKSCWKSGSERPFWNWMPLRAITELVCAYQSASQARSARSELGNQEIFSAIPPYNFSPPRANVYPRQLRLSLHSRRIRPARSGAADEMSAGG